MSTLPAIAPWAVWWCAFDPQVGTEQWGRRPAIVVGSEYACSLPNRLALVVPCTSTDRGLAWHPPVNLAGRPGFAMCDQVKALSVLRLKKPHPAGTLDPAERDEIAFVLGRFIARP